MKHFETYVANTSAMNLAEESLPHRTKRERQGE